MSHQKIEALELLQQAAKIAQIRKSTRIAEAVAEVVNALMDDKILGPANVHPYAMVMNELIASGALRVRVAQSAPEIRSHC